jgi:hypothetical protein
LGWRSRSELISLQLAQRCPDLLRRREDYSGSGPVQAPAAVVYANVPTPVPSTLIVTVNTVGDPPCVCGGWVYVNGLLGRT